MEDSPIVRLGAAELRALVATRKATALRCEVCASLKCPGWESMPASFDRSALHRVATLRDQEEEEPTLREFHPRGTHGWSEDAPIAPGFSPYNRCDVWSCKACGRSFLRYTEYGGYYEDERIRQLNVDLIEDAPA